jgi:hypothetical protein
MTFPKFAARILLAWATLAVIQIIMGMLVPLNAPQDANLLAWLLLTNLLVVAVLAFTATRSGWCGWRLALSLFSIPFGIALVNIIEGAVYLTASGLDWRLLLLHEFLVYAAAAPVWTVIFRGTGGPSRSIPSRPFAAHLWRFAVSDFAYLFLYFLAGMIIFPFVRAYYATQTLPGTTTIISLQLLLRGPVFIVLCVLMLRMLGMRRGAGALALGAAFTILSGVAPLLIPNPVFPDSVRWVHFCEVTSSNFVFGAFVGWIWGQAQPAPQSLARVS